MMRVYSARLPFYFLAVQAAVFDRRKMRGEKSRSIREAGGGNTGDLAACYCREKLRTWGEGREEEEEGGEGGDVCRDAGISRGYIYTYRTYTYLLRYVLRDARVA